MKTLKQIIKFLVVVAAPIVALTFYIISFKEIFNLKLGYIAIWHIGILFILFNSLFYAFHMSRTKLWKRFDFDFIPGFGILVAIDGKSLICLIGFISFTFNYEGLCRKQKPRFNLKKENKL